MIDDHYFDPIKDKLIATFNEVVLSYRPATMGSPSFSLSRYHNDAGVPHPHIEVMGWDSALTKGGEGPVGHIVDAALPDSFTDDDVIAATKLATKGLCQWAESFKSS